MIHDDSWRSIIQGVFDNCQDSEAFYNNDLKDLTHIDSENNTILMALAKFQDAQIYIDSLKHYRVDMWKKMVLHCLLNFELNWNHMDNDGNTALILAAMYQPTLILDVTISSQDSCTS